ncbi:MAG TPA: GAF domain-containing protein [Armatimonadetes bacterium]|nr:GAF domain-containing protein [Armatimonadota bacterium]
MEEAKAKVIQLMRAYCSQMEAEAVAEIQRPSAQYRAFFATPEGQARIKEYTDRTLRAYVEGETEEYLAYERERGYERAQQGFALPEVLMVPATAARILWKTLAPHCLDDPQMMAALEEAMLLFSHSQVAHTEGYLRFQEEVLREQEAQVRRQAERLAILSEIGRAVSKTLELPQLYRVIYEQIRRVMDVEAFYVALYHEEGDLLEGQLLIDQGREYEMGCMPLEETVLARTAIRERRPVVIHRTAEELASGQPRVRTIPSGDTSRLSASLTVVPLLHGEQVLGVISVQSYRLNAYPKEHVDLLMAISGQVAVALENARLYTQTKHKAAALTAVEEVARRLAQKTDPQALFAVILTELGQLIEFPRGAVYLYDEERQQVKMVASKGVEEEEKALAERTALARHHGWVIRHRQPLLSRDARNDPRLKYEVGIKQPGSLLCVPILYEKRCLGEIVIVDYQPNAFDEEDLALVMAFADHAAVAIENARLFQAVVQAKKEWERTFDSLSDGVLIRNPDFTLRRVNTAGAALVGKTPEELVGQKFCWWHGSENPCVDCPVEKALRTKAPTSAELEDSRLLRTFHVSAFPILDEQGEILSIIEYIRDVTEAKQAQAQLLQAGRMAGVGELAAGIAHNFNNVLMGADGMIQLLLLQADKHRLSAKVVQDLQRVHQELQRGADIVKRLLKFARGAPQIIVPVQIAEAIEEVIALCGVHPASRGVSLYREVPPGLPLVRADAAQLREVLTNLVVNALQASSEGDRVSIKASLTPDGEKVEIKVEDTGCGIPAEDLPKIFDPFFSRRRDEVKGTGLGLPLSLRMVKDMGGQLEVESKVNVGTTVTLTLPLWQNEAKGEGSGET